MKCSKNLGPNSLLIFLRKSILKRQNTSTNVTKSKKTLTYAGWHKLQVYLKELLVSPHNAYPPFAKEWTSWVKQWGFLHQFQFAPAEFYLCFLSVKWSLIVTQVGTILSAWGNAALGILRQEGLKNKELQSLGTRETLQSNPQS